MIHRLLITLLITVFCCYMCLFVWNIAAPIKSTVDSIKIVSIKMVDPSIEMIENLQNTFHINQETAKGIYYAARANDLDPMLYAHLINSESEFKVTAYNHDSGYKGIAQTPTATWRVKTDLMHGAEILREKLDETKNNLEKALAHYKGGDSEEAHKGAREVLKQYRTLLAKK